MAQTKSGAGCQKASLFMALVGNLFATCTAHLIVKVIFIVLLFSCM
jgi:hypothetical protein